MFYCFKNLSNFSFSDQRRLSLVIQMKYILNWKNDLKRVIAISEILEVLL